MECPAQQPAHKLAQLQRTIAQMANMLQTHSALQDTQWQGIKTWWAVTEEIWDAYQQDDLLLGKGITVMVGIVVTSTERDQREESKADTEDVGLEAVIHGDLTQTV